MFSISLLSVPLSSLLPPPPHTHTPTFPPPDLEYVTFVLAPSLISPRHHAAPWLVCFALAALWFVLCTVARVIYKNGNLIVTPRLNIFQWFLLLLALKTKRVTRPMGLHELAPGYLLIILSSLPQIFLTHWLPFHSSNKPYPSCHRFLGAVSFAWKVLPLPIPYLFNCYSFKS